MNRRPLLAWCLVLAAGCSVNTGVERQPDDDEPIDPTPPVEQYLAADFEADYLDAACDWFDRCVANFFADRKSCEDLLAFGFSGGEGDGAKLDDPLLFRVDAARATACVQLLNARGCSTRVPTYGEVPECLDVFVGRLNEGECCDGRGGCAPGLTCERGDPEHPEIGYCSAIGEAGETCSDQDCAAPASCQAIGNTNDRQCVVSLGLEVGEGCDATFDCAPGLSCQQPLTGDHRKCLPRGAVGDYCFRDQPCGAGVYCSGAPDMTSICQATPGGAGDVCYATTDCGPGLTCTTNVGNDDLCLHHGTTGESCSADPTERCAEGLVCLNGVCGVPPVPTRYGDPCHPDGPSCPSVLIDEGECVDSGSGYVCAAPPGLNEPCSGDLLSCSFSLGLGCDQTTFTCVKLPVVGEACPQSVCHPFLTVGCQGTGASARCQQRKPVGSPCTPQADEDKENILLTECTFFSLCLPDPSGSGHTCQRILDEGGEQCQ